MTHEDAHTDTPHDPELVLRFETLEMAAESLRPMVEQGKLGPDDYIVKVVDLHEVLYRQVRPAPVNDKPLPEPLKPAVPVNKSVTDDYLVCLDTGKRFKSLKRHLATLGMTPAEYRAKWRLPADYPMVAPAYAEHRSKLARDAGLGRRHANMPGPVTVAKKARRAPRPAHMEA